LEFTIPNALITNIKISNFEINSEILRKITTILQQFRRSIKVIKLEKIQLESTRQLVNFFDTFENLKSIIFDEIKIESNENTDQIPFIQSLSSITLNESDNTLMNLFHLQINIEKISISRWGWSKTFTSSIFNALVEKLPNFKHLVMNGVDTAFYFNYGDFPFKIETLEVYLMTFYWNVWDPRLKFLNSQKGHLKELKLSKLPYDFDGDEILKYIIEEMDLRTFYYGNTPLILNGKKQNVKEFMVQEVQIQSAFEMFRQFPCKF
jgi:hypothetical protein